MNIILCGGGRLGYFLARDLLARGHRVTVVDDDRDDCDWLARRLRATILLGRADDPDALEEAGAHGAEAVVAMTARDDQNLMICRLSRTVFDVPQTISVVNDPDNEAVFRQLGVTATVSVTRLMSDLLAGQLGVDAITHLLPGGQQHVVVSEIRLPDDAPVIGRPLRALNLPSSGVLACVIRRDRTLIPRGDTVLEQDDRVIVVTQPSELGSLIRALTGEQA